MKTFITSINAKLFDSYGRRFIETWRENAAKDVNLIICFEGDISEEVVSFSHDNVLIINIDTSRQIDYLNKFGNFIEARGVRLFKNPTDSKSLKFEYNFRYDAIRFSFKIFSFIKCLELNLIKSDFAWIDADMVCLKSFNSKILNNVFPENNQLASYLGRNSYPRPNAYTECGFLGFNYSHPKCIEFIEDIYKMYATGDVFKLKEWHDCMVFDSVRTRYESMSVEFKNLSAHLSDTAHPFIETELGTYFDHLKGRRKILGHS